jgi:RimJ/RimL family protein N-acetyltransferase
VVSLRRFTLDDVEDVTQALQDPEVVRWTASIPSPYTLDHATDWIEQQPQNWESGFTASLAVCDAESGALLGCINVLGPARADGGVAMMYWVAAWNRRRGVATRALVLATQWASEALNPKEIHLETLEGNVASERVAQKGGYVFSGTRTGELTRRGSTERVTESMWIWREG